MQDIMRRVPGTHGWTYRIETKGPNTGERRHIQVNDGHQTYGQNDNGSPHGNNEKGDSNVSNKMLVPTAVGVATVAVVAWLDSRCGYAQIR